MALSAGLERFMVTGTARRDCAFVGLVIERHGIHSARCQILFCGMEHDQIGLAALEPSDMPCRLGSLLSFSTVAPAAG